MATTTDMPKVTDIMEIAFDIADEQIRNPERSTVAEIVAERMGERFDTLTVSEQEDLLDDVERHARIFVNACKKALAQARALNGILATLA